MDHVPCIITTLPLGPIEPPQSTILDIGIVTFGSNQIDSHLIEVMLFHLLVYILRDHGLPGGGTIYSFLLEIQCIVQLFLVHESPQQKAIIITLCFDCSCCIVSFLLI